MWKEITEDQYNSIMEFYKDEMVVSWSLEDLDGKSYPFSNGIPEEVKEHSIRRVKEPLLRSNREKLKAEWESKFFVHKLYDLGAKQASSKYFGKFADEVHSNNVAKGFYEEKKEVGTMLMLIVSEIAEAMEADRTGKRAVEVSNFDFSKKSDVELFEQNIKNTFEDEIADTFIRLLDLVGYMKIDIDWHIQQKLAYNKTRPHKHGKKY